MSPTWTRTIHLFSLLTVAACSGALGSPEPTGPDSPRPTVSVSSGPTGSASPAPTVSVSPGATSTSEPSSVAFEQPWALAALTDVTTGEVFRIADLAASGKVVFVETMAIWCSNCRAQQVAARAALEELGAANVEWVVIDVETAETAEALARYRNQNGFPFRYVIADTSLSRSLVDQFGDIVLSPPSVNVIVLGTDGRITHLLGHHDSAALVAIAIDHGA